MSVQIPAPFENCFDDTADDWLASSRKGADIGSPGSDGDFKEYGGVPMTQSAWMYRENTSGVTTGHQIEFETNGSQQDLTDEIVYATIQFEAPERINIDTLANRGCEFRLYTDNSNFKRWSVGGQDTAMAKFRQAPLTICVDPTSTETAETGSTYDVSTLSDLGIATTFDNIPSGNTANQWVYYCNLTRMATIKDHTSSSFVIPRLYGTSVKLKDLFTEVFGTDFTDIKDVYVQKLGDTYFYGCPFAVGTANHPTLTTATSFDDEGITVLSPSHNDSSDPRYQLSTNAMRVYFDLRSGDTATLSGTYIWGTAAPWDLNATVGTITLNSPTFKDMGDITCNSAVTGDATFDNAGDVIMNGTADLDGSTITNDLYLNNATNLSNITVNGDLRIATGANSTLTFTNVTVAGSVFNDSASNTLTINATGGSMTAGDAGTGNGQTNIVNTVTLTVTAQDSSATGIENARVYLEAASGGPLTAGDEIINTLTNASGIVTDSTFNYSSDQPVTGVIRKGTSSPRYKQGVISGTITSTGFTTTVTLVSDE